LSSPWGIKRSVIFQSANIGFFVIRKPCLFFFFKNLTFGGYMNEHPVTPLLRAWFEANGRDLPWRRTKDPYRIWISEVVLQQTRVDQGAAYYERFIERFPTVAALAEAEEGAVLKVWEGLGYYSRARNLLRAAVAVAERFGGELPRDYAALRLLPGIGPYTAAAVASFAWDLPHAVVDGNVARVLSRLFALDIPMDTPAGRRALDILAAELLPQEAPGRHNQAIMELGALCCLPRSPHCGECPVAGHCLARAEGNPEAFPLKSPSPPLRDRFLHYFYVVQGANTWIRRRPAGDIWAGLYEFPLVETERAAELLPDDVPFLRGIPCTVVSRTAQQRLLTHRRLHITICRLHIPDTVPSSGILPDFLRLPLAELSAYPFPRTLQMFLSKGADTLGGTLY
jgi:A/G-specific adenine glycosylase